VPKTCTRMIAAPWDCTIVSRTADRARDTKNAMIYFLAKTLSERNGSLAGMDFLEHMLAPGRDVTVVCLDRYRQPTEIGGEPVAAPHWLVCPSPPRNGRPRIISPKPLARYFLDDMHRLQIERALRQDPPILAIHNGFPLPTPGWMNTEILERSSSKVIIVHSSPEALDFFTRSAPSRTREWVGERLRRADALVFVTPQIRDSWSQVAGLKDIQMFVVPNTTREDEALRVLAIDKQELRRSLDLPQDAFLVSCVGRVDVAKGDDVLVEALPAMLESVPHLYVVFVGSMTRYGEHLPSEIEAMGLSRYVRFVGSRDDAYSFIRASDMLVHPSRAEGQGLVVLEAMVLGTPILASDVGGIPFTVGHGSSGWLVPSNDAGALAAGFSALAGDTALRERLIAAARERYWNEFSRAKHRERVQSAIGSCYTEASSKFEKSR
jgi:glycosyltransferase involved in cell wall biosynthesis